MWDFLGRCYLDCLRKAEMPSVGLRDMRTPCERARAVAKRSRHLLEVEASAINSRDSKYSGIEVIYYVPSKKGSGT